MNRRFWSRLLCLAAAMAVVAACAPAIPTATPAPAATATVAASPTPPAPSTLTVMTHDSFAASDSVVKDFEQANNVKLQFLKSGDAGTALNKAILSKDAPLADVFYGVDNTYLSRALQAGIYQPYASPALASIPAQFQLDPSHQALPVDYGDVCVNYDVAYFSNKGLTPPQTLEDLAQPAYKGLLVTENPATSSPGLAFLLATVSHFGTDHYLDFWKQMRANDVKVDDGWETAYYTDFSGSSGKGPRPLVVSYASSPPAEVIFATPTPTEAPTASMVGPGTCFRQIEFVGILKGTKNLALAQKWVDYMLGPEFQADMPLQMFVFPVLPGVALPPEFTRYAQVPAQPATLSPDDIAANRDAWIAAWTQTVLR